eukprot:CAMPEP_0197480120 /NCGR_PEP_ID=MMETSP1309-20131121/38861_1 /TAXON_ID=464262 /ORGANISM="Genus nov. species nov., Strain RCC998" /LENGTH=336 /DNA_ID=CAMNT_0043021997 /DNA_START=191 /DNA_END=1204 /DNA_ORIENTATION=+
MSGSERENGRGRGGLPFPPANIQVIDVDGDPTEVVESVSLMRSKPALEIIIFPGNPGSALFYIPYMQYLHDTLEYCVRVRTVSHLGHSRDAGYKAAFYTLEDQVMHKLRFLETEVGDCDETPVLVVGHSIGGFMAIEAVKRWSARLAERSGGGNGKSGEKKMMKNCRILAQMPYMQFDESSSKQRSLEKVAQRPYIPAAVSSALGLIPKFISVRLIKAFDKNLEEESAKHVANQLFSYTVAHNAFSLAQSEFRSLRRQEIDWKWLGDNWKNLGFVFCPDDHWSPEHLCSSMRENLPKSAFIRFEEDQFHGFVTRRDSSMKMAELTKEFLSSSSPSS